MWFLVGVFSGCPAYEWRKPNPAGLHGLVFLPVCLAVMGPSVTQVLADPGILALAFGIETT